MLKFKFTEYFVTHRSKELLQAMATIRGIVREKQLAHWERNHIDYTIELLTAELASVLETYEDKPPKTFATLLDENQINDIPF